MRLIDADALWSNLAKYFVEMKKRRDLLPYGEEREMRNREIDGFREALYHIKDATIDAVHVVRCEKCDWYREDGGICVNPKCGQSWYGCRVPEQHFCSYGERRSDD